MRKRTLPKQQPAIQLVQEQQVLQIINDYAIANKQPIDYLSLINSLVASEAKKQTISVEDVHTLLSVLLDNLLDKELITEYQTLTNIYYGTANR